MHSIANFDEISRNGKMHSIANFETNFAKLLPSPSLGCISICGSRRIVGAIERPRSPTPATAPAADE